MVYSRCIPVAFVLLAGLLVTACNRASDAPHVVFATKSNADTSWSPKWDTAPDKSRKLKSVLSPTVSFADEGFRGSPIPQNESEKEQERQNQKLFVESFRSNPQCNGITLKLKDPKEADFSLQVFSGIDGRTGRWQYVLYRMDTLGEKEHGEGTGGLNGILKSVCPTIREAAFMQGGTIQ